MIESTFQQPKQYISQSLNLNQITASGGDPCGYWVYIPCWQSKDLFPGSSNTGQKSNPINTSKSPWTTSSALVNEDLLLSAALIHHRLSTLLVRLPTPAVTGLAPLWIHLSSITAHGTVLLLCAEQTLQLQQHRWFNTPASACQTHLAVGGENNCG